jgi:hypothetical protein
MTATMKLPVAADPTAVRLRLNPGATRGTVLDGAWWPHSADAAAELPPLLEALGALRGEITDVLMHTSEWDLPHPRKMALGRRVVRLGWYDAQPAGLLTVMIGYGSDRFDLLVVPAQATDDSAEAAMTAAADPEQRRRAPDLLAAIELSR